MSDLLIKNMDMPNECYKTGTRHCPRFYTCDVVKHYLENLTFAEHEDIYTDRLIGCPLVELPDNHGRIVDLDKVLDWLINEKRAFSMKTSAIIENALKSAPTIMEASNESTDSAPTIVESIPRGRFICIPPIKENR